MTRTNQFLKDTAESVVAYFQFVRSVLVGRLTPMLGEERGELAEKVVIICLFVVAATVIGGIVINKLTTSANNIQTP